MIALLWQSRDPDAERHWTFQWTSRRNLEEVEMESIGIEIFVRTIVALIFGVF